MKNDICFLRISVSLLCFSTVALCQSFIRSGIKIARIDSGPHTLVEFLSDASSKIRLVNIGLGAIAVNIKEKSLFGNCADTTGTIIIEPGQDTIIDDYDDDKSCLTMVLHPGAKRYGIYYATRISDKTGVPSDWVTQKSDPISFEFDLMMLIRLLNNMDHSDDLANITPIPELKSTFKFLIDKFFPTHETDNRWDLIIENVLKEIVPEDRESFLTMERIFEHHMDFMRIKIDHLYEQLIDENPEEELLRTIYIKGAVTLHYLSFPADNSHGPLGEGNVNYYALPLYARVVNMKLAYYGLGLAYKHTLQLTDEDVDTLFHFRRIMVLKALSHVKDVQTAMINEVHDTIDLKYFFNKMMEVRTFVGVVASGYFDDWERTKEGTSIQNLRMNEQIENNAIIYSEYFGISTPKLYLQAIVFFNDSQLSPQKLASNDFARLDILEIYETADNHICGLDVIYDGYNTHSFGQNNGTGRRVVVGRERITKMDVGGDKQIEYMIIYLSNGQVHKFGYGFELHMKTFEHIGYYISSIAAYNDDVDLHNQFANMAVTYRQNPRSLIGEIPEKYIDKSQCLY